MSQQTFGRYILKGTLGRGAMGMVYLALDPILDRLSAIKVMNTGGEVDEGLRTRFFREAKSAARLRHPNIIAIYEMGEEDKRPFIAMEYVEGQDLKALIEKRTFIPFEQKIRILVQVCEALSYAHQQGVIHRDIKPANVRIAQDGNVRILDFGLARLGSSDITRTGMLMGTPYYMSPEQVRGVRDLDGRSDLFSVAVLFYELLGYARPFEAESATEVCLKIVSEPHTPLASVLPKVDADLEAIIDRALSKNRDARQHDCQELAQALKEYALTIPQRLKGLEAEVARLEKEWKSCCDASQHLVQLGILEESLLAPPRPSPAPSIDPEETTVYNFSLEASQRDFGALLLTHAHLHRRLEEVRQRLRAAVPLQELFERGRQQRQQGEFESCLKTLTEILEMAPQNARALEMQSECLRLFEERRAEEERRAGLKQVLALASEALEQGSLADCIQSSSRALQIDPGNSQAQELKQKASEALARRRKVAELLAVARGFHKTQNYESACQVCAEALALDPTHAELRLIQQQAQQILERQSQIQEGFNQAQEKLRAGDYLAVLGITDKLLTLEPDLPRALEMQQQAAEALERQLKLEELLAVARHCEMSGDFAKCLRVCDEVLRLEPEHREAQTLQRQAAEGQENQQHFEELLVLARDHSKSQNHADCLKAADEALAFKPEHAELRKLREKAAAALECQRRIHELLEEAQEHERAGELELALEKARAGLRLEAHNTQFLSIQSRTTAALEHPHRVSTLLSEARQQLNDHRYEASLRSAEELLKLDREHPEGHDLKQAAAAALERLRKLNQSLAQAKANAKSGLWEECLEAATEGLRLDPAHAELLPLESHCRQMLEKIRRMAQLLQDARAEIEAQNYAAALKTLDSALKLESSNAEALQLKQKAEEAWERQKQLAVLLNDAQRHLKASQFEACLQSAGQGLALEADHPLFKELTLEAQRQLELRSRIEEGLKRGSQHLEKNEYQPAVEAYDSVLTLAPGQVEAVEGRQRAHETLQRQQCLKECLARAKAAFDAKDFQSCHAATEEGLGLEPAHSALQDLAKKATQIIERTRRVQQLWNEASQNQQKSDLPGCLHSLDSLLELDPENAAAQELRPKVVEALERQRRTAGLLAEAASLEKSGDLEACQRLAGQALEIDPQYSQAQQFHQRVSLALERQRQIQKLLEQVAQRFEEQDDAGALKLLEELLRLDPAHPRGLEIQSLASKRLEYRKRVEQLLVQARKAQEARDPETCLQSVEQGLQLEPAHAEFKNLQAQSREQLAWQGKIRELVSECQRQLDAGALEASIAAAERLESHDPGNTIAADTRQKANEGLERRRRLLSLLTRTRELIAAGDFAAGHTMCNEAIEFDPSNTELLALRKKAFKVLESRRREEESQRRTQQLLASAKASFQGGRFRAAQRDLMALLELDGAHTEARRLLAETETQRTLARQKNFRLAKIAAAAVLVVSALGSGLWVLRQRPASPPPASVSGPRVATPPPGPSAQPPQPSAQEQEIARMVSTSNDLLRDRKNSEAEKAAEELLSRVPGHSEGTRIKAEARKNLTEIDQGLKRARALLNRKQYQEVASVLDGVLKLDPAQGEALQMGSQLDRYLQKNAEDARRQMQGLKSRAEQSKASALVQSQYQIASLLENDALKLLQEKKFGAATGKFYQAKDAYLKAEGEARAKSEAPGVKPVSEKPATPSPGVADPPPNPVDHQKEEREKQQLALLKGQAQDASTNYLKALVRATQASAERLAPEAYQPATNLATRAQDKFNQGNYAGAQSDFGEALRQMENATVRAEEVARLRRVDEERKQKEQVAAQNHPAPPPPQIGGSGQKADDRQLVLEVLRRYEVAMNHKSIKELKEVWSLEREEEKRIDESFKFAKSMQCHLQNSTEPRISGDTAIVNCRRIVQITTPDGKQRRNDSNVTVTLRKKEGNWIIETMR